MNDAQHTIESVYREHASKVLAVLVRIFGTSNLELAEDVLQDTFRKAMTTWSDTGVPERPAAWVLTAARNQAIDVIRSQRTQTKFAGDLSRRLESDWTLSHTIDAEFTGPKIQDDQLRMMFMCAGADITPENRIPLILRTLCGFSIPAISRALFLPEATVKKRLLRTRERLAGREFALPPLGELPSSMDSVHIVIYLLFNEGFHSSEDGRAMNLELCQEALLLADTLLAEPRIVNQDTFGLIALMQFHVARASARTDEEGHNVTLDQQDRSRWDAERITLAEGFLRFAPHTPPGASGRFLLEARIASEHCRAPAFQDTDWQTIVYLYGKLVEITGSPIARLNEAVAIAYAGDTEGAIDRVTALTNDPILRGSHLPLATLAHLHAMRGDSRRAEHFVRESTSRGGTAEEQRTLRLQVERLLNETGRTTAPQEHDGAVPPE